MICWDGYEGILESGRDRVMMEYKGYRASVTFDSDAGVFHCEVVDTRDVIVFEGTSVEQLQEKFQFSIDDYLTVCAERGREPDKPFSGQIPLRVSSAVHRSATATARSEGKSVNSWLAETVERAASETLG